MLSSSAGLHSHRHTLVLQGSGKTHTLLGDVASPTGRGVVPRAVAELAQGMREYEESTFKASGCCPHQR